MCAVVFTGYQQGVQPELGMMEGNNVVIGSNINNNTTQQQLQLPVAVASGSCRCQWQLPLQQLRDCKTKDLGNKLALICSVLFCRIVCMPNVFDEQLLLMLIIYCAQMEIVVVH